MIANADIAAHKPATGNSTSTWAPVDLTPVFAGEQSDPPPSMLARTDGHALLYPGRIHALSAESESGKTWLALAAAKERLEAGERVLYIDFEDGANSVVGRLKALGVDEATARGFLYVRPDEPLEGQAKADLQKAASGVTLAVLDGVTEALVMHGWDLASNTDVAKWLALLPRPLAMSGAAVVTIDHVVKDKENRGRYAIGAQHKLAGVDVAYTVSVAAPFGRGRQGRLAIKVTKDRPGHVRGFASATQVADVHLISDPDGSVRVQIAPPGDSTTSREFRPTYLMEQISRRLEKSVDPMGVRAVRDAVTGKNPVIDVALRCLIDEGFVSCVADGQARRHASLRPFREGGTDVAEKPVADGRQQLISGGAIDAKEDPKRACKCGGLSSPDADGYCESCGGWTA